MKHLSGSAIRYNDFSFRLIISLVAAHCVVAFGENDTLFELLLNPDYWRALIASFVIAFILVNLVYFVTTRLDRYFDWRQFRLQRTILQVLLALLAPAVIAFLLAYLYFRIYGIRILDTLYLKYDYPVIILMLVLLNVYYLTFYFYKQSRQVSLMQTADTAVHHPEAAESKKIFVVQKGAKNLPLSTEDICYFYRDQDYNYVRTFDGENFLVSQPLDEIQELVDNKLFFRANRQFLVNREACKHFEPLKFSKLELSVAPAFKHQIIISQKKAKAFKEWIENNHVALSVTQFD